MKISALAIVAVAQSATGFMPQPRASTASVLAGYLDDLSKDLTGPDPNPVPEEESREATNMDKESIDRFGVGSWDGFVEFNEFDGGDGQMGVAGDGNNKLGSFDMSEVSKSKSMSAKNAWGSSSGYADTLIDKGVDKSRAQQLENWHSQQEVLNQRKAQRSMTDQYDAATDDEDWRTLSKFGVERNQDFDMDEAFGTVEVGDVEGVIELHARMNGPASVHEFGVRNPYMGFADFRAAFTADSCPDFTVTPGEGSLMQKEDTQFLVRYKAQKPGVVEGYLVVETEDEKRTWKVVGTTS